jgi:isopentenyl phosphate kinase
VRTEREWRGYAEVAAAAAQLNRLVTDQLIAARVPVQSFAPSASARCGDGVLTYLDVRPIGVALDHGIVPLVFGDVAIDEVLGGTIVSTEDLFVYLADHFRPARILLVGETDGVLRSDGDMIPFITPATFARLGHVLSRSGGVDVTGGMAQKIARMVELVEARPGTEVHILSGLRPGLLYSALLSPSVRAGTRIAAG